MPDHLAASPFLRCFLTVLSSFPKFTKWTDWDSNPVPAINYKTLSGKLSGVFWIPHNELRSIRIDCRDRQWLDLTFFAHLQASLADLFSRGEVTGRNCATVTHSAQGWRDAPFGNFQSFRRNVTFGEYEVPLLVLFDLCVVHDDDSFHFPSRLNIKPRLFACS